MLNLLTSSSGTASIVVEIFVFLIVVLAAMPLHEYAHGWTAKMLGDTTPERSGRLTLNPIAHIDPMGAIAILLFGIGWAKPVPINPYRCTKVKPKAAMAITAIAGPLSNILFAYIAVIIEKIIYCSNYELIYELTTSGKEAAVLYLFMAAKNVAYINIYLAVFNLLPIPPFDGSRIFLIFLPTKLYFKVMRYERVIMGIMMLLLFLGVFSIPLALLSELVYQGLYYATGYVEFFMGI